MGAMPRDLTVSVSLHSGFKYQLRAMECLVFI